MIGKRLSTPRRAPLGSEISRGRTIECRCPSSRSASDNVFPRWRSARIGPPEWRRCAQAYACAAARQAATTGGPPAAGSRVSMTWRMFTNATQHESSIRSPAVVVAVRPPAPFPPPAKSCLQTVPDSIPRCAPAPLGPSRPGQSPERQPPTAQWSMPPRHTIDRESVTPSARGLGRTRTSATRLPAVRRPSPR